MKPIKQHLIPKLIQQKQVRIYTFQNPSILDMLDSHGYISGVETKIFDKEDAIFDDIFKSAYDWMKLQMYERMDNFSGEYPIWAYLKRPNNRDLRYSNFYKKSIRITAIVPIERILISDMSDWDFVLNKWYLSRTETESDEKENATIDEILESWQRIFDIDTVLTDEEKSWRGTERVLQACIDRIYKSEIVSIRDFK